MADNNQVTDSRPSANSDDLVIDVREISNPVLKRLVEEVRQEKTNSLTNYNRTHNRHNRGR